MVGNPKGAQQIQWQGIPIAVIVTANWLNTGYHHIELRADQPLPVTTTGYRSHFIPADQLGQFDDPVDFVVQWLDRAAQSKEWQQTQERLRQPKLL